MLITINYCTLIFLEDCTYVTIKQIRVPDSFDLPNACVEFCILIPSPPSPPPVRLRNSRLRHSWKRRNIFLEPSTGKIYTYALDCSSAEIRFLFHED